MSTRSESIVGFMASLLPLYTSETHDRLLCARSLTDGTLLLPVDEPEADSDQSRVCVRWQGDPSRECEVDGPMLATVALERYVRLHGAGCDEEVLAAELWYMARHFHFKTGSEAYLPELPEPASRLRKAGRVAVKMGQGVLVNIFSKVAGLG